MFMLLLKYFHCLIPLITVIITCLWIVSNKHKDKMFNELIELVITPLVYVAIITVIITCLCCMIYQWHFMWAELVPLDWLDITKMTIGSHGIIGDKGFEPNYCYNNMFMLSNRGQL